MASVKICRPVLIRTSAIEPNPWNPFKQDPEVFQMLVEEISQEGFDEQILVVPISEETESSIEEAEDGDYAGWLQETGTARYRVVNGEHRLRAKIELKSEWIPCVIKRDWEEIEQKLQTVRRNYIHGRADAVKITSLLDELSQRRKVSPREVAAQAGILDPKEFQRIYIEDRLNREEEAKSAKKKTSLQAVDDLSSVLRRIFEESGGTAAQGYIAFAHNGQTHFMVSMSEKTLGAVTSLSRFLENNSLHADDFMRDAIISAMESAGQKSESASPIRKMSTRKKKSKKKPTNK